MAVVETIRDVVHTTYREAMDDDLTGEAAKIAYFFFLSLFPLVLILFALTGIVGGDAAFVRITSVAESMVPNYAWQFVRELIREITDRDRPGILSVGILLTIWAASNGVASLTTALNRIYDIREARGWWKRRAIALAVLVLGTTLLVIGGAFLASGLARLQAEGHGALWASARAPVVLLLVAATIWLAFYYLPARDQKGARVETAIGAVVSTIGWGIATLLFSLYVSNFGRYSRTYGAIGAVIVLLIWFYLTGFAILVGAELAAVLEARRQGRRPADGSARPDNKPELTGVS